MKKLILATITGGIVGAVIILFFMFVFDVNKKKKEEGLRLITNDSTENTKEHKAKMLVYGDYKDLDSTDYMLIPLGMKTLEGGQKRIGSSSINASTTAAEEETPAGDYESYKYNFYSLQFENCNNIIFYNKKTEETHLLLQKPAIISEFYFPYPDKKYKWKKYSFLLLGIREDDSNADGYINDEDAEKVYTADLSGQNMIQINPDNTQLMDWYIDSTTNNILLKVRYDSNKDQKYNAYDDVDILKTQINNFSKGSAIINPEIKENIQGILNKIK
ncbi:MAG TPA: hypothetical protein VFF27_09680 [Bacteroidia bacterium]|jgi:hypothetical protein|nr:hypothetical protein [Bacteroidia bacterium]